MSGIVSNTGSFRVREGKLLLVRLGPVNGQVQTHRKGNTAPARRGVWAFPHPFHDAFFYWHKWERLLPKRLNLPYPGEDATPEERDRWRDAMDAVAEERSARLKEIVRENPLSRFWCDRPFYSHIAPREDMTPAAWHLWDNARDWVAAARKHIWCRDGWERADGSRAVGRFRYSLDHMELFVPL
jgi:hypothetical protein